MSSGILALTIFGAILVQILILFAIGIARRKREIKLLRPKKSDTDQLTKDTNSSENSIPAWQGFKEFIVQHRLIEDINQSICSIHLIPADGSKLPEFKPGQYLTFKVEINDPKSNTLKTVTRCYSLSDSPHEDYFRVSIKRSQSPATSPGVAPGLVSNHFHEQIKRGSRLLVKAPAGQFHLMTDTELPIVLIAGGIGITPMLSMINTLLEQGSSREIHLFYGVRNAREVIMKQHFNTLAQNHPNFHLHLCYSAPDDQSVEGVDYQHQSRVDIALLRSTLKLMRYQFYICGPAAMLESLVPALQDWGVDEGDIYFESFGPSSLNRALKAPPEPLVQNVTINFSQSGKTVAWDNSSDSLLEFAESHGIEVESGCRSGSCGGCQSELKSGDIVYSQQPDIEVDEGHCLLCISTPKSDLILNL